MNPLPLSSLANVLNCTQADFHVLHLMASGKQFFMVHSKAEEYYDKLRDDYDIVLEMCISLGVPIQNPLVSANQINYKPLEVKSYSCEESFKIMHKAFGNVISYLTNALQSITSVGSKATLESMLSYYEIERNYKLSRCIEDD